MFESLTIKDARPIAWLKRAIAAVFAALLLIGAVSSHRAYFQVRSLDVKAPPVLTDGSTVAVTVVCSGRNWVDVEAELIQGEHSEALLRFRVPGNNLAFFDPRAQHASQTAVLNNEILTRFQPGAARLRVVATGRPQWGRRPPPTVRELDVTIQSNLPLSER
ncbi:MAG TPA: hypothetical protein VFI57_12470 [Pyrinomonadaceae bacterium]|nr:hypothetical protein [Pyrinomonadaceae bacterium]